jgi:hypothetical protein
MSQFNPDASQYSKLKGKVVVLTGTCARVFAAPTSQTQVPDLSTSHERLSSESV